MNEPEAKSGLSEQQEYFVSRLEKMGAIFSEALRKIYLGEDPGVKMELVALALAGTFDHEEAARIICISTFGTYSPIHCAPVEFEGDEQRWSLAILNLEIVNHHNVGAVMKCARCMLSYDEEDNGEVNVDGIDFVRVAAALRSVGAKSLAYEVEEYIEFFRPTENHSDSLISVPLEEPIELHRSGDTPNSISSQVGQALRSVSNWWKDF